MKCRKGELTISSVMKKVERKSLEFKIGMCHGIIRPKEKEQKLRNDLFLVGKLRLVKSRKENIDIRLVAYEMPIKRKNERTPRDKCVDLFGYDREYRPYNIIELKKAGSNDRMEKRIFKEELDSYAEKFKKVKKEVESGIEEAYFLKNFEFSSEIQKIFLAPRKFYSRIGKGQFRKDWELIREKMDKKEGFYACYYNGRPNPESHGGYFKIHILNERALKRIKKGDC